MADKDATAGDKDAGNDGAPGSGADESKDDAAETNEGSDSGSDKSAGKTEKTFTQTELDRIVQKRLDKELKKLKDEKELSETDKLKKSNEELQKSLRERDAYDEFETFFSKKGVKNTKGLFRALKGELEFDDAGKITNFKDLQAEAADSFAEFFPNAGGGADGGEGEKDGSGKGGLTKEQLSKMKPEEINKLPWDEVAKVMAAD